MLRYPLRDVLTHGKAGDVVPSVLWCNVTGRRADDDDEFNLPVDVATGMRDIGMRAGDGRHELGEDEGYLRCHEADFRRVVVVTDTPQVTSPCGACRQILWEFAGDVPVVSATSAGATKLYRMADLHPEPFEF